MDKQTNQDTTSQEVSQDGNDPANVAMPGYRTTLWHQLVHAGIHLLWKYKIIVLICIGFFFIVGVPFIINELYSHPGYMTMWSAADVLGYYGTILSAFVGIYTLAMTIWFTRCQIQRESYLQSEKEKWDQIEKRFAFMLDLINPMRLVKENINATNRERLGFNVTYRLTHMIELDKLCTSLYGEDLLKVQKLLVQIRAVTDATDKVLKAAFDKQVKDEEYDVKQQLCDIYFDLYSPLVEQTVDVFNQISSDIQVNADKMLYFWRKH